MTTGQSESQKKTGGLGAILGSPRFRRFVLVLAAALLLGTFGAAGRAVGPWLVSPSGVALSFAFVVGLAVRFEELTPISRALGALSLASVLAIGNPRLSPKIALGFLALSFLGAGVGALAGKFPALRFVRDKNMVGGQGAVLADQNFGWKASFLTIAAVVAIWMEAPAIVATSYFLLFIWERIRWEQDIFLRVRMSGQLYFATLVLLLFLGSPFAGQVPAPATLALGSLTLWCAYEIMTRLTDLEIERHLPAAVVALLLSLLVGLLAVAHVPAWAGGALFLVFAFLSFLAMSLWGTARGTWLRTIERAELALFSREEGLGVPRRSLHILREGLGEGSKQSPTLYFRDECWSVDVAGYAESKATEIPKDLPLIAREEPFAIVRRSVVRSREVRDARYRPISEWMTQLELEWIVALDDGSAEEEPARSKLEFLGIPKDGRDNALTIAEATAFRSFANKLRFFLESASAEEKWRQNHLVVVEDVRTLREKAAQILQHETLEDLRGIAHKSRLLRQAEVGIYSPAIRDFCTELSSLWQDSQMFFVNAEPGGDPLPLLLRELSAHTQPQTHYTLYDAADADWNGATTPIELAEGGLLVLEHVRALPAAAVERLEKERRCPTGTTRICLMRRGVPSRPLLALPVDLPSITYPPLRDRAEDLSALLIDAFARASRASSGRVSAPTHDLLELLVSHPFMGNERELQYIVDRLLAETEEERISRTSVQPILDELRIGSTLQRVL